MRLNVPCRPGPIAGLIVLFVLGMGMPGSALAQEAAAGTEEAKPLPIELDLQTFLFDSSNASMQDPVWDIKPQAGQRLVFLPLRIGAIEEKAALSRCPIKPRSGRFIGYYIPVSKDGHASHDKTLDVDELIGAGADQLQSLLFASDEEGDAAPGTEDPPREQESELQPVPASAPRMARELVLHPDGTVQWEMDRVFSGATLKPASEQSPYPYKIDARLLAEKEPPRPERITRNDGEDPRLYAQRKRELQLKQRADQQAFRDLRNSLRELPDEFREPMPPVIYAVYSLTESDRLLLQGRPPLPWTIKNDEQEMLKKLAQGAGGLVEGDTDATLSSIKQAAQAHVLSARGAAFAALRGGLASKVKIDDPGYELIVELLNSKDPVARRVALYGVARAQPASIASAQLLGIAGKNAVASAERELLKFSELRQLFEIEIANPESVELLVSKVNTALADQQGPSASSVISEVLKAVGRGGEFGGNTIPQSSIDAMVQGLDLDKVSGEQLTKVIQIVIDQAPGSAIAAGWMDAQLLGGKDSERIHQTLELLSKTQVATAGTSESGEPTAPTTIPIDSAEHGMIRAISGSDPLLRARAWPVIDRFHLAKPKLVQDGAAEDLNKDLEALQSLFDLVMSKALAEKKTPTAIVSFLDNPHEGGLAEAAPRQMVLLLLEPGVDQAVAQLVAEQMMGSEGRLSAAFSSLKPADQPAAAAALYKAKEQDPPLATGLLAGSDRSIGPWFLGEVGQGRLPDAKAWSLQAGGPANGGETKLLQVAASGDSGVASSAAAALVVNAGGDANDELAFAQTVGLMDDRNQETIKQAWIDFKTKLHTRILEEAQGSYRLVATLRQAPEPVEPPSPDALTGGEAQEQQAPEPPTARYELGLVNLRAAGATVSLSVEGIALSVSPDILGIRIDSLASLKALESPDLKQLPMDQLSMPIDLLPQEDGSWSGQVELPDQRVVGVLLELAS